MEEDRSKTFSPSKLSVYRECPRRYQYRYVDRISRKRKTPETVVGVAVHAAFEELYERLGGGKLLTLDEVWAAYDAALEAEWDESVRVSDPSYSREDWKAVGRRCVGLYYDAHKPFDADRTVGVERKVGFPLEVDGAEYRIEGYIDRLSVEGDGDFVIHDYKTAKTLPDQAHADADWQLALYELAVRRDWPDLKSVKLRWHYVRHGVDLTSTRDAAAREGLRADVAALISAIKHDHAFTPRPGRLCDWCEYKDLCPEFAHAEKVAALPPAERKKDDGVRLVDALAEIEAKRRRLKDELKTLELEKGQVDARLADFAQAEGVTLVAGTEAEASVTVKEETRLPTRTDEPEQRDRLEKDARATPLWDEVARLDDHALVKGAHARRWTGERLAAALKLLEDYGRKETVRTVRLKRRRGGEED